MASPRLEDGYVPIANDLFVALVNVDLSGLEKEVILAVMYFTYGNGKSKAAIDPQDVQAFLGGQRRIRADRVKTAFTKLVNLGVLFAQQVNATTTIYGIQKDFEQWRHKLPDPSIADSEKVDKNSDYYSNSIYINTNTIRSSTDKLSTLIESAHEGTGFKFGPSTYGVERKHAKLLYAEALELTKDPAKAMQVLLDFIAELRSLDFFIGVKMRMVYMSSRFRQWYKCIPAKPRSIREQEEDTGYRYRYNLKLNNWEMTGERIADGQTH